MPHIRMSRLGLAGGVLALSLTVSACGGAATPPVPAAPATPSASAPSGVSAENNTEHNEADVHFAQTMIPHHRQAVEMAGMALDRAENPDVKALAEQIRGAQDPEIERLTELLQAWGAEVPADGDMAGDMAGMEGMDHSGMDDMSGGMMTPEQMGELQDASGAAFDKAFLDMMIVHHEGAVRDAEREVAEGINPQATELARQIISAQNAEIARMRQLLQAG